MTAPDPIDLDHLDALYAAAGAEEWCHWDGYGIAPLRRHGISFGFDGNDESNPRIDSVVALHNAWPAISAELRRLRDYDARLSAVMPQDFKDWHANNPREWPLIAASTIERLRERLAESERDAEAFHAACQDEASRCMRTEHENEKLRANNNSNNNNKEDGK